MPTVPLVVVVLGAVVSSASSAHLCVVSKVVPWHFECFLDFLDWLTEARVGRWTARVVASSACHTAASSSTELRPRSYVPSSHHTVGPESLVSRSRKPATRIACIKLCLCSFEQVCNLLVETIYGLIFFFDAPLQIFELSSLQLSQFELRLFELFLCLCCLLLLLSC